MPLLRLAYYLCPGNDLIKIESIWPGMGDFYVVRPLMDIGIPLEPGVLRMSFLHYTSMEAIDQLITGLKTAL